MAGLTRRTLMALMASTALPASTAFADNSRSFIVQAFAMKQRAIDSGDQPYGAVVVRGGEIVGYGPSRVILKNDQTAHAEREAIRDAQARLGRADLSDCVMYSTSPPCSDCRQAAAAARLWRLYAGEQGRDLGQP